MAENLDDGEFWLPPQFLSDDDNTTLPPFELKNTPLNYPNNVDEALFPSEFPYGFSGFYFGTGGVPSSDLNSPLGGSSETESDEEEHLITELTRRMARSTLEVDFKNSEKSMGGLASGSPQSTLCAFGSGCGCRKGSSQGSPNSVCKLSSARATWDLLHAAAGEVERMRLSQEGGYPFNHHNHNGFLVPQRKPSPVNTTTNPDVGFFTQQSLSHQQLQIAQFQMLRQQQMAKQQNNSSSVWGVHKHCGGVYQQRQGNNQMVPNRGRNSDVGGGGGSRNTRPLGLSASAWPSLQHAKQQQQQNQNQQYGSGNGMRAVFLGNPGGMRECAGTGVFLPRPAESRKKPACSTALVPARVVQALNLKLEDMVGGQPQHFHRFNASSNMENATVPRLRSNYVLSHQKRNLRPQPAMNHEIRLPQEWTY